MNSSRCKLLADWAVDGHRISWVSTPEAVPVAKQFYLLRVMGNKHYPSFF
jgi:hypothetical protein